jgi:hypothetical protein
MGNHSSRKDEAFEKPLWTLAQAKKKLGVKMYVKLKADWINASRNGGTHTISRYSRKLGDILEKANAIDAHFYLFNGCLSLNKQGRDMKGKPLYSKKLVQRQASSMGGALTEVNWSTFVISLAIDLHANEELRHRWIFQSLDYNSLGRWQAKEIMAFIQYYCDLTDDPKGTETATMLFREVMKEGHSKTYRNEMKFSHLENTISILDAWKGGFLELGSRSRKGSRASSHTGSGSRAGSRRASFEDFAETCPFEPRPVPSSSSIVDEVRGHLHEEKIKLTRISSANFFSTATTPKQTPEQHKRDLLRAPLHEAVVRI